MGLLSGMRRGNLDVDRAPWLVIGLSRDRSVVVVPQRGSLVVLGEPGTGKSTGLIQINAFPDHQGATYLRSTRHDNLARVARSNIAAGRRCVALNLDGCAAPAVVETLRVSLLDAATTWSAAKDLGLRLMRSAREVGVSLDGTDQAFESYGGDVLAALLYAASIDRARSGRTFADVATWIADAGLRRDDTPLVPEVILLRGSGGDERLAAAALRSIEPAQHNARDILQKINDAVGHLLSGSALAQLSEGDRRGATSLAQLIEQGALISVVVPEDNPAQARSHAAVATLIEDGLVAAARRAWRHGDRRAPFRLLYDESATGAVNPNVASWAATGGGDGIAVVVCAQGIKQLARALGRDHGDLFDVFTHRLLLRGHAQSADELAKIFGTHEVQRTTHGVTRPFFGMASRTTSVGWEVRARVQANDLVTIPDGYGLLIAGSHLGPIALAPSYDEPWRSRYPR